MNFIVWTSEMIYTICKVHSVAQPTRMSYDSKMSREGYKVMQLVEALCWKVESAIPNGVIGLFIDLNLSATLWPWGRLIPQQK